ncbi:MAG: primosomal protein N' [Firmicutes bacterium]|nr:primosomal protein N' [Bacillota bacterium]
MLVQVLVNVKTDNLDRLLTYRVPHSLSFYIKKGVMIRVPLGKQIVDGWVWEIVGEDSSVLLPPGVRIREIKEVVDNVPVLSEEIMLLASWIKKRYYCCLLDALLPMLPPSLGRVRDKKKWIIYPAVDSKKLCQEVERLKRKAPRQAAVLETFLLEGSQGIFMSRLLKEKGHSRQAINALEQKGLLKKESRRQFRNPREDFTLKKEDNFVLSAEQKKALECINEKMKKGKGEFLLCGVTGSGKTEIYLRVAKKVLEQNKGVIVLVPEITLTPQMTQVFASSFGDKLAVLHSRLSPGERYDEWWRVRLGEAKVVLGARSAVFAPLDSLGLIIIDEEHEISYKQEESPRYHARDVARWRCRYHGSFLLLGSATPSLESYYRNSETVFSLRKRVENKPLPHIQIVDMRKELNQGHKSIFSRQLIHLTRKAINQGEQVLLFLNRRGYASFVLCRSCGQVERCPHCEVPLTYHAHLRKMMCHYCSYTKAVPIRCSACMSPYIKLFGVGTQKVELEARRLFPFAGIIRIDSDTTATKGSHKALLDAFCRKEASILVGTQMIAKGLNFPEVTLVGIVAADIALNFPDFRAGERTFQLLTQVAGRSGRGSKKGMVVIQTYAPQHESIRKAAAYDLEGFYRKELERRRLLKYPPFQQLLLFLFRAANELEAEEASRWMEKELKRSRSSHNIAFDILGPVPSPLVKVKGYYRWQLLVKGCRLDEYSPVIKILIDDFRKNYASKVKLTVDFDPYMML